MTQAIIEPPTEAVELIDAFYDVPMATYLGWKYWSSSLIDGWRHRTPRYMKWLRDEGGMDDDDSASKSLGTLVHTAIFEPDLLEVEFVVEPEPDPKVFSLANGDPSTNPRSTKAFKEAVAELEATGKTVVTREAWDNAMEMRDAAYCHSAASKLLKAAGPVEASAVVTDPETGVRLKIRPDKLVNAISANVNAKTTRNATRDAFMVDLYKLGYFRNFAFYDRALKALGWEPKRAIALAIDSTGPLDDRVAVHELDEGAMDAGHQLVEKYLLEIARCESSGIWPGHPQDIRSITLPEWAWSKVDEEIVAREVA